MPSGRPDVIAPAIYKIMGMNPNSILDVGSGFGKWGLLLREYLEVWQGRWKPSDWKKRICAVEAFEPYRHLPWYYNVYDAVYPYPIEENHDLLAAFDLVLWADVLEHMEKTEGQLMLSLCNQWLALTPNYNGVQGSVFGNPYEAHVSRWTVGDFIIQRCEGWEVIKNQWIMAWGPRKDD